MFIMDKKHPTVIATHHGGLDSHGNNLGTPNDLDFIEGALSFFGAPPEDSVHGPSYVKMHRDDKGWKIRKYTKTTKMASPVSSGKTSKSSSTRSEVKARVRHVGEPNDTNNSGIILVDIDDLVQRFLASLHLPYRQNDRGRAEHK